MGLLHNRDPNDTLEVKIIIKSSNLFENIEELLQVLLDRVELIPLDQVGNQGDELSDSEEGAQEAQDEGPGPDVDTAAALGHSDGIEDLLRELTTLFH